MTLVAHNIDATKFLVNHPKQTCKSARQFEHISHFERFSVIVCNGNTWKDFLCFICQCDVISEQHVALLVFSAILIPTHLHDCCCHLAMVMVFVLKIEEEQSVLGSANDSSFFSQKTTEDDDDDDDDDVSRSCSRLANPRRVSISVAISLHCDPDDRPSPSTQFPGDPVRGRSHLTT